MKLPGPYGDTKVGSPSYSDTGAVAHAYAKTAPKGEIKRYGAGHFDRSVVLGKCRRRANAGEQCSK